MGLIGAGHGVLMVKRHSRKRALVGRQRPVSAAPRGSTRADRRGSAPRLSAGPSSRRCRAGTMDDPKPGAEERRPRRRPAARPRNAASRSARDRMTASTARPALSTTSTMAVFDAGSTMPRHAARVRDGEGEDIGAKPGVQRHRHDPGTHRAVHDLDELEAIADRHGQALAWLQAEIGSERSKAIQTLFERAIRHLARLAPGEVDDGDLVRVRLGRIMRVVAEVVESAVVFRQWHRRAAPASHGRRDNNGGRGWVKVERGVASGGEQMRHCGIAIKTRSECFSRHSPDHPIFFRLFGFGGALRCIAGSMPRDRWSNAARSALAPVASDMDGAGGCPF